MLALRIIILLSSWSQLVLRIEPAVLLTVLRQHDRHISCAGELYKRIHWWLPAVNILLTCITVRPCTLQTTWTHWARKPEWFFAVGACQWQTRLGCTARDTRVLHHLINTSGGGISDHARRRSRTTLESRQKQDPTRRRKQDRARAGGEKLRHKNTVALDNVSRAAQRQIVRIYYCRPTLEKSENSCVLYCFYSWQMALC